MKLYDAVSLAATNCIRDALKQANGNMTQAAALLGVHRTHLYRLTTKRGYRQLPPLNAMPELANWRRV